VTLPAAGGRSSLAGLRTPDYDVFVVHAAADESFVQGYLIPKLALAPERVLVPDKLRLGRPIIGEIERGVRSSRVTIVMLSPAYMTDHWAVFGEQLAAYASVAKDVQGELLPLLLEDCELPTHIRALVKLDFRDSAREVWTAEMDRLHQYLDQPAVSDPDLPCPYPGMRPFTEQDATRFFGRDAELDDLVLRLRRGDRAIYVIGASGSGKSSLIAAGLVPRISRGTDGLPSFHVRTIRPGDQPLAKLADALEGDPGAPADALGQLLAPHLPATSLLLVIDQLEELFAVASAEDRLGFLVAVRALRADPRCVLVFTLRSDFYGAFMESALWTDVDGQISRIELSALRSDSLRVIIEHPARDAGVYVQPELVSRLLVDAAREPGALPLLQEALLRLWGKRRERLLALADYLALGDGTRTGLAFAISEHANDVLGKQTHEQDAIAFRIFLRLVSFGEGRADTRRQQPLATLRSAGESAADFELVLQRLVENRLITVTGDKRGPVRVDLAHEILIHAWSTFAEWIRTWRAAEQDRRELEAAAAAWRARGSGDGGLLDPVELAGAVAWRSKAAHQLGHTSDLVAFLAASDSALSRAVRERRRLVRRAIGGISLAVAALLAVSTLFVIRIIRERDRADQAAKIANEAHQDAERRTELLMLAQARSNVELNPTKAVAMLKPLAQKYWREVRAIAAAARAWGVAWSIPVSRETVTVEMSHDGLRALSAGDDGVVRLHDLRTRATRTLLDLHTRVSARFAADARQVVVWHDTALAIVDVATGTRQDLTAATPIIDLEVIGATAYWIDGQHKLWQRELAGAEQTQIPLPEGVTELAPSPGGRWIAFTGEDHLFLWDRTQPTVPWTQITMGKTRQVAWSADGESFAALIDQQVLDVATLPVPAIMHRQMGSSLQIVAHGGRAMYVAGINGIATMSRDEGAEPPALKQVSGDPIDIVEARGRTIVAGATGGLTVISDDGDRRLPLQAVVLEHVFASPRSPYVIGQLEGRLLVWNLDDIQPRRIADEAPGGALFATADQVITGGTLDGPAQSVNTVTAAAQPLGARLGLRAVTAPVGGHVAALVDAARHVHLVSPGREPEDLPDEIDIAGFATDDKLVLATVEGAIYVHDVTRHERTPLGPHPSRLIGLAWGHGHHPWVAAALIDGTLWRKNLVTGVEATAVRVPSFERERVAGRDGKLIVGGDGTVLFLHDHEVHAWRADGGFEQLAKAPKLIDDFGEAGADHLVAVAGDTTMYTIARNAPYELTTALSNIDGASASASMSADAGLLVVLNRGAVDIVDPLAHQQWTLAPAGTVPYASPAISPDGRRVLAQTPHAVLLWSIELPANAADTVAWLDAMTNAVDDLTPRGLGWR
jgi:hypothetical protein